MTPPQRAGVVRVPLAAVVAEASLYALGLPALAWAVARYVAWGLA